jgi:hypothetical protein
MQVISFFINDTFANGLCHLFLYVLTVILRFIFIKMQNYYPSIHICSKFKKMVINKLKSSLIHKLFINFIKLYLLIDIFDSQNRIKE